MPAKASNSTARHLADWVGRSVVPAGSLGRGDRPPRPRRAGAACRRHHRPGAGARLGEDQDRTAVGGRSRRAARSARIVPPAAYLSLLAGPQGHPRRGAAWPCRGFLHADGYAGFESLYRPTTPQRRAAAGRGGVLEPRTPKFYEVHHASASPIAWRPWSGSPPCSPSRAASADGHPIDAGAAREEHARPLLDELKTFLDTSLNRVSGKSALAEAIRYTRSRVGRR